MTVTLVFEALQALHRRGITILLVEQNVNTTLHIANKAYLLEKGEIALEGNSAELLENSYLRDTYLGAR
jgi:branched-chain amino acid transport system ATP-binding protein